MTSKTYTILENDLDPRKIITEVVKHICAHEKKLTLSDHAKKKFSPNYESRDWGQFRWDEDDITDFAIKYDNGRSTESFSVRYGCSVPCGRGCCSDYYSARFLVPDNLVELYEEYSKEDAEPGAWQRYDDAVAAHVKLIWVGLEDAAKKEIAAKKAAAKAEKARRTREKEKRDREEFERLKAKFGEQA